jgi:hypothetical protein
MKWSWKRRILADPGDDAPGLQTASKYCTMMEANLMTACESSYQQQYLNLETFRKSGVGFKTPVWFVQDGETLFVRTVANSGNAKRIRFRNI